MCSLDPAGAALSIYVAFLPFLALTRHPERRRGEEWQGQENEASPASESKFCGEGKARQCRSEQNQGVQSTPKGSPRSLMYLSVPQELFITSSPQNKQG